MTANTPLNRQSGQAANDHKADVAQNTKSYQIDPIMLSKWKSVFVAIVVLVALGDTVLAVTGAGFLVHSQAKKVMVWEGDIVLPVELAPKTGDVSKPKDAVYCTYWRGFSTTRIDFPARLGCPRLLPN